MSGSIRPLRKPRRSKGPLVGDMMTRCVACGKRLIRDKGYPTDNAGYLCATCRIAYGIGIKDGVKRGELIYADKIPSNTVSENYSKLNERLGRIEDRVNVMYMYICRRKNE